MTHTPNEQLMQQIMTLLNAEPLSIHHLHLRTGYAPKELRQALSDLRHYGRVIEHSDGVLWGLVGGSRLSDREEI